MRHSAATQHVADKDQPREPWSCAVGVEARACFACQVAVAGSCMARKRFKSPQLHQPQCIFHSRSERHLPEIRLKRGLWPLEHSLRRAVRVAHEGLLSDLQHRLEALLDRRGDAGGHLGVVCDCGYPCRCRPACRARLVASCPITSSMTGPGCRRLPARSRRCAESRGPRRSTASTSGSRVAVAPAIAGCRTRWRQWPGRRPRARPGRPGRWLAERPGRGRRVWRELINGLRAARSERLSRRAAGGCSSPVRLASLATAAW
jgi:hypothetical protein